MLGTRLRFICTYIGLGFVLWWCIWLSLYTLFKYTSAYEFLEELEGSYEEYDQLVPSKPIKTSTTKLVVVKVIERLS